MRQQQAQIGVRFGVAREHQFASVGGRQMHVEHLHGGELFQHRSWGKPTGQRFESSLERDLQAVGKERHEDARLNAFVLLVIDGADRQIVLQLLESLFDLGELNVELPQQCWGMFGEIGAQQIVAFARKVCTIAEMKIAPQLLQELTRENPRENTKIRVEWVKSG